jgi:hypothetical protein
MRYYPHPDLILGSLSRERYERCLAIARQHNGKLTIQMIIDDALADTLSPFADVVNRDEAVHVAHSRYMWVREMVGRLYLITVGRVTEKVRALVSVSDGQERSLKPTPMLVRHEPWVREVTRRAATFERSWRTHAAKIMSLQARPASENWWMPQVPRVRRR